MKTYLLFAAFGLAALMTACQKETPITFENDALTSAPADRCGCLPPFELNATNATDHSADLHWTSMPEALAYRVEVSTRFSDAFDDVIFLETTESSRITVDHLAPNTRYEYRVTTICGNDESEQSDIRTFYTADILHGDPPVKTTKVRHDRQSLEKQ